MAKFFDEQGNEVEALTQEEADAKVEEAKKAWEEEMNKNKDPEPEPEPAKDPEPEPEPAKDPEPKDEITKLREEWDQKFQSVESKIDQEKDAEALKFVAGEDADLRKDVQERYERLTGYEKTEEGRMQRAKDAFMLATGTKFEDSSVNFGNLNASSGINSDRSVPDTEKDKEIQSVLGITPEMVEKYKGNKK